MKKQDNVYRDFKTEMDMTPRGFGLPKKLWRQLFKFRNKKFENVVTVCSIEESSPLASMIITC